MMFKHSFSVVVIWNEVLKTESCEQVYLLQHLHLKGSVDHISVLLRVTWPFWRICEVIKFPWQIVNIKNHVTKSRSIILVLKSPNSIPVMAHHISTNIRESRTPWRKQNKVSYTCIQKLIRLEEKECNECLRID